LAIGAGAIFSMTMGRRLRTITDNTVRVSAGEPLNPEIKGNDELAKLDHLVHSMNDELAKTRKRERAIIDNTAEIICSLDRSFRVEEVNDAVQRRLAFSPANFRGSLFQSHVEESERQMAYECLKKTLGLEDEVSFEVRMVGGDGKIRDMEVTAQWSEEDRGIFCIMRDITLRKEAERMKQEVIAMISHDLRAPLTSIGMTLEMFCDGVLGELNERGDKLASVAKTSVGNLIMMINDLLDLERLEATGLQLNYEPVAIESIVRDAIDSVSAEASSKQLSIESSYDDGDVSVDGDRIRRVLVNLLNNAIKFSPASTMILVKAVKKDGRLRVEVIDEGPGIPEEQLPYVFDKFRQVGTGSAGEKKGSGLGLAICKSFVEAHNGKIGVNSKVGEGTTFWFDLPVAAKVPV
ncbi:MAG TPA: PAS domain-containing sensor histidine kinase, partial [Chroococcales cyanobacterium]